MYLGFDFMDGRASRRSGMVDYTREGKRSTVKFSYQLYHIRVFVALDVWPKITGNTDGSTHYTAAPQRFASIFEYGLSSKNFGE